MSDLCRKLDVDHTVDFMAVSSYGNDTVSSGTVRIIMDLRTDIAGKHVIICEDIIDSGNTLAYLRALLEARNPLSVRIVTLLNKPVRRTAEVKVDWVGFNIEDRWVVGYGMDWCERLRCLPYVGVLKKELQGTGTH
jgi:hypoxanthine phosphoribosyltransferase